MGRRGLLGICLLLILVGVIARLNGLGQKLYWVDEVYTSFRVLGIPQSSLPDRLRPLAGATAHLADVTSILAVRPGLGLSDTVGELQRDDPHHSPLYFLLAQAAVRLGGPAPAALRSVAAISGILAIGAFAWLCLELGGSGTIATLGAVFFSLSPFQLIYSQQAREYSLWVLTTLVASALLLRALRIRSKGVWIFYGFALTLSLYSYLFSLFVVLAHAFVVFRERSNRERSVRPFFVSVAVALSAFSPWLWTVLAKSHQVVEENSFSALPLPLFPYLRRFFLNLGRVFVDFDHSDARTAPPLSVLFFVLLALIIAFEMVSIWKAFRSNDRTLASFVNSMFWLGLVLALASDLFLGGRRALVMRYWAPSWIAVTVAVTFWIGGLLSDARTRVAGFLAAITLAICGCASFALYQESRTWWSTRPEELASVAEILSHQSGFEIVTAFPTDRADLFSLAYFLRPETPILFYRSRDDLHLLDSTRMTYLYRPTPEIEADIAASGRKLLPVHLPTATPAAIAAREQDHYLVEVR